MRVSYNWLREYVDLNLEPEELAHRLTMAGVAVDAVERLNRGVEGVVVGEIRSFEPHPHSDKLLVAAVDTGKELLRVVTGAPGLQAGRRVPVAVPGSRLPGGWEIRPAEFRGVVSQGMLCSLSEITLGEHPREGEGVLVLPPDAPLGEDIVPLVGLDDAVLELDLTPNYAMHCLSMVGVAREVAAITGQALRFPELQVTEEDEGVGGEEVEGLVRIDVLDPDRCPRYSARMFTGLRPGPSPLWLQRRLEVAGMRPINNMVDITNYVMLELGQPLHAFDYHRLEDGRIVVRLARPGEEILTLDGTVRGLSPDDLIIADARRPVGIAGVMGGLDSEVTDRTEVVLLESAHFEAAGIRRTARRHQIRSEAALRFEKWVDPNGTVAALDRAAHLVARLGVGRVLRGVADAYPRPYLPKTVELRPDRANQVLGTNLSPGEITGLLERLGLEVSAGEPGGDGRRTSPSGQDGDTARLAGGETLLVTVPTRRRDLEEEIDLVEEIARLHGYNRIPSTLPGGPITRGVKPPQLVAAARCRQALVGLGLSEVITFSFVDPGVFDRLLLPADSPLRRVLTIRNPLREEQSVMRTTLIPNLLETVAYNASRRVEDLQIFELGTVYRLEPGAAGERRWSQDLPDERFLVAGALTGLARPRGWQDTPPEVDFFYLKGIVERLLWEFGVRATYEPGRHPSLHPGRQARVLAGDGELGVLGEIHPRVGQGYDLKQRVYIFELDFSRLTTLWKREILCRPLPRYPAVTRDVALVVEEDIPASRVEETIRREGGALLEAVTLFDLYRGAPVPPGHRSLAYSLVYRAPDRTLTDAEVDDVHRRVRQGLERELGARLRE